jgi:predicted TIM-barrel fold metal-dependent hydrolase
MSYEDYVELLMWMNKRTFYFFKVFFVDTAVEGSLAANVCGVVFFTPERVVFASDCPFDKEKGPGYIRDTIKVLNSLGLPQADMEKICYRNAEKIFGIA